MRINKYIAKAGVCSRRKAEELINQRKVKINNKVISELGTIVKEKDIVKVNNKVIKIKEDKIYLVLNKPRGYITTSKEQLNRKCVMDLIDIKTRVYPVGRLDRDTEGLLIFTNDGDFTNKLTHPSSKVNKEYIAKVEGEITKEKINLVKNGVEIDGYVTSKAIVKQVKENTLSITIHEGKNRQVRKMCEKVDLKVVYLKRIRIGNLNTDGIKKGKYITLSKEEIIKKIGK